MARRGLGRPVDAVRVALNALITASAISFVIAGAVLALPVLIHPAAAESIRRGGGLTLVGIGALILVIRPSVPMRWPRGLIIVLAGFAALQLLDVATTLWGASVGLAEGNRLATALTDPLGSAAGFLIIKLAGVIVLALGMARLPHRVALLTGISGCCFMTFVVVQNAVLIGV